MIKAGVKQIGALILLMSIETALAQPKQIIIIRHAEEPRSDSIHLSSKGQRRAEALAEFFQTNAVATQHGLPFALFAPRPERNRSRRSEETLIPTSVALSEPIREPFKQEDYKALAKKLLRNRNFRGKTIVIAWTHKYIARLAAELGARPTPRDWKEGVYDRALVLTRSGDEVKVLDLPQRLLPGDSER